MNDNLIHNLEKTNDRLLRANSFDDIVGRDKIKKSLKIMIEATKKRGEALDHILFYGPPGLGKTTLAMVTAKEINAEIYITSGPSIERQGDLASILTNLPSKGILFIDEIHRLNKAIEEILYPAMEDRVIDIVVGKGPSARTVRIELEDFSLIGATTRMSLVSAPLRSRFGATFRLDFYTVDELKQLVLLKAKQLQVKIDEDGADEIAKRSRGTARIAIRLLKRVREFIDVNNLKKIDKPSVQKVLSMYEIDSLGLDGIDRKILEEIIEKFDGGPVGLNTISAIISEDVNTIADVYEPYLIQAGLLKRTQRGRVVTKKAFDHLGIPFKDIIENQLKLSKKIK